MDDKLRFFLFGILPPSGFRPRRSAIREPMSGYMDVVLHKEPFNDADFISIGNVIEGFFDSLSPEETDCTIEDVSFGTGIRQVWLNTYFNRYLAKDFRSWKTEYRIRKFCSVMDAEPNLRVTDVARKIGFRDLSNFHRQFKRVMGVTPKQWQTDRYQM